MPKLEPPYHVGMVVADLAAARLRLADLLGVVWGPVLHLDAVDYRDGAGADVVLPSTICYSVDHPSLELIEEVRRSQNATDRFDSAVAEALGLNRTDMRCLDVIQREGAVTAACFMQPGSTVLDGFGDPRVARRHDREPHRHRLQDHVRDPVSVAVVRRDAHGEHAASPYDLAAP